MIVSFVNFKKAETLQGFVMQVITRGRAQGEHVLQLYVEMCYRFK